LIADSTH
jgi:hypothetical protein